MPADWIASRDGAFQTQAEELVTAITTYAEVWGLSVDELLPLQQCKQDFDQVVSEQTEVAALYHATVARKQAKREELERALRAMVRRINNHPGMTGELREQMKLASPIRTAVSRACRAGAGERTCPDKSVSQK